jgi:hypothetical protein
MTALAARSIGALILALTVAVLVSPAASAETPTPEPESTAWRFVDVEVMPQDPTVGQIATVRFSIEDENGNLVTGLRATGMLRAPSTAYDATPPSPILTTIGRELNDPGRYEIAVALNHQGRWWIEIRVEDQSGNEARYDHFAIVDPIDDPAPATVSDPLFLRGDQWDSFFRVDPETGAVATLDGDELFRVGDRWWVAETVIQRRGTVSNEYGGTWRLTFNLRDAIDGADVSSIEIGDIRANVFSGSDRNPAISTAITIAPDGSAVYAYWARQLGEGWLGYLAVADPATGEILERRIINGAISSNGFWAELYLLDDQHIVVAEQVVELATVSGYRLTLATRDTLETRAQYRRTDARDDPLTHCMLTYPGPVGTVQGSLGNRYSLCSPPDAEHDVALVVWSPITGQPVHTVELENIAGADSLYADGVASPDGSSFYAVNTRTMHIAEIDMISGDIVREKALLPDDADPSTLDRFFEWVFGAWSNPSVAAGTVEPSVTISHDGTLLYAVNRPEGGEPGVLVVDLEELEIVNNLISGQQVDGLVATVDGRIAVIERGNGSDGDTVTIMDSDGSAHLSLVLPGRSDVIGSRR